MTFGMEKLE